MRPLTVLPGGRNRPEVVQVERREWDETRISLVVSRGDRVAFVHHQHRLLSCALAALFQVQPDVDAAERFLQAALRLVAQEATRAAADVDSDPTPMRVAA